MRAALVAYFDLGQSYGISDSVFRAEAAAPPPSIGNVGVKSPLGWGTVLPVQLRAPEVLQRWRDAAGEQIGRQEIETGWSPEYGSRENFDAALHTFVRDHPVDLCEITVFAVGVAYLNLQFGPGIPMKYLEGMLTSFEYAAYTKPVSEDLAEVARQHATSALERADSPLQGLTRRAKPLEFRDEQGYLELDQFTAFTRLYLCVDDGDGQYLEELLTSEEVGEDDHISFEYHGVLHYTWASCVLESKSLHTTADPSERMDELERMLVDVKLAHVFLGTCEAYVQLVLDEIKAQTDVYGGTADSAATSGNRGRDLNRLRTMALAVINLTQYYLVTQTSEDQRYFSRFEAAAQIGRKQDLISNATEVLFNVQSAEQQEGMNRRENLLNSVAVTLASLTLVSVVVDSYNFVREQEPLLPTLILRMAVLIMLIMLILTLVLLGRRRWAG